MLPPVLVARLRRYRIALLLLSLLTVFHAASSLIFEPTARRYERAVRQLGDLGLGAQAAGAAPVLPPRVYRLMADNGLPAGEVERLVGSGGLASSLLETVTRLMSEAGMRLVATEPGTIAQQTHWVQVRIELQARASYSQVVDFLDRLSRSGRLVQVDRLKLLSESPEQIEMQLALSQYVYKMGAPAK